MCKKWLRMTWILLMLGRMFFIVAWKLPTIVRHYLIPLPNELGVYIVWRVTTRLGVQLLGCSGTMVCSSETGLMLEVIMAFGSTHGRQGWISTTCCIFLVAWIGLVRFPSTSCMRPISPNEGSFTWSLWALMSLT